MGKIYSSAEELIGATPLLDLNRLAKCEDLKARVLAKLERNNPAGSAKDRVALAMINDGESPGPPSSSPPPAIRVSALPWWRLCGATTLSSSCPTP